MARIAGIDLPRSKRIEVALTYIYGVGRSTSRQLLAATGDQPAAPHLRAHRGGREPPAPRDRAALQGGGHSPDRGLHEHQAPHGHRLLPGPSPPPRPPGARPENAHQRPHQEGSAPRHRGQEEGTERSSSTRENATAPPSPSSPWTNLPRHSSALHLRWTASSRLASRALRRPRCSREVIHGLLATENRRMPLGSAQV